MRIDTRLGNGAEAGGMTEQNNQANLVGGTSVGSLVGPPSCCRSNSWGYYCNVLVLSVIYSGNDLITEVS